MLAEWALAFASEGLERLLNDPEVDLVLALGMLSGHEVARRPELSKPVLAPLMLDPALQDP